MPRPIMAATQKHYSELTLVAVVALVVVGVAGVVLVVPVVLVVLVVGFVDVHSDTPVVAAANQ
jgi:hypothetical protein